ncbi:hypothetical protein ABZ835_33925 [Streptomyces sp. NPDC047461]|uniref:hypothetical protein n=1 Tax=Streptomyces sp. NPDC047461 TaxID=3155619 RepID=UPI0033FA4102
MWVLEERPSSPGKADEGVGVVFPPQPADRARRRRHGRGFCCFDSTGQALRDREELERIRALVFPPALQGV